MIRRPARRCRLLPRFLSLTAFERRARVLRASGELADWADCSELPERLGVDRRHSPDIVADGKEFSAFPGLPLFQSGMG